MWLDPKIILEMGVKVTLGNGDPLPPSAQGVDEPTPVTLANNALYSMIDGAFRRQRVQVLSPD